VSFSSFLFLVYSFAVEDYVFEESEPEPRAREYRPDRGRRGQRCDLCGCGVYAEAEQVAHGHRQQPSAEELPGDLPVPHHAAANLRGDDASRQPLQVWLGRGHGIKRIVGLILLRGENELGKCSFSSLFNYNFILLYINGMRLVCTSSCDGDSKRLVFLFLYSS